MKYNYQVKEFKPVFLQQELNTMGLKGWDLLAVVPLNHYSQTTLGPPTSTITFQCFFKKLIEDDEAS
jgi:hypothetical protein